jgi:hypothetical protein
MKAKKPWTVTLFGLATLTILSSCSDQQSAQVQIRVEPNPLVLPTVPFGESTEGQFLLHNPSDEILYLQRIGPTTCECESLSLDFLDRPLAPSLRLTGQALDIAMQPGEKMAVKIKFDSSRFRRPVTWKRGAFALLVKGTTGTLLEYEIDIWNPYWVEPWRVDFGTIGPRQRPWKYVLVRSHDATQFDLLVPEASRGWEFRKTGNNFNDTTGFKIEFRPPPEMPMGPFQEIFEFQSNLPDSPPIRFWAQGKVETAIFTKPKIIQLYGESLTAEVRVFGRGESFKITSLEWDESLPVRFSPQPKPIPGINGWTLEIEFSETPKLDGVIRIFTDHPEHPQLSIPIRIPPSR